MPSMLFKEEISSLTEYIEYTSFCFGKMFEETYQRYSSITGEIQYYDNYLKSLSDQDLSELSNYEVYKNALDIRNAQRRMEYFKMVQKDNPGEDDWQSIVGHYHTIPGHTFLYRGQFKYGYGLCPSIMRNDELIYEDTYYHQIKVRTPESFINKKYVEQLTMMQHHGCNTRLLDISSNPLVALYFACANFGCEQCSHSEEGAVFIFNRYSDEVVYFDDERVKLLSLLPMLSYSEKQILYEECMDKLRKRSRFNVGRNNQVFEKLIRYVQAEQPSFKNNVDPLDLLTPIVFQPIKDNARILKQDGAFIISGLSKDNEEAEKKLQDLCWRKIKIKNPEIILRELDQIGVNEATLFPEIDSVAHYLKGWAKKGI